MDIFVTDLVIIIKSEISNFPIVVRFFCGCMPAVIVPSHSEAMCECVIDGVCLLSEQCIHCSSTTHSGIFYRLYHMWHVSTLAWSRSAMCVVLHSGQAT